MLFAVLGIAVTVRVPKARRLLGMFSVFLAAILLAFVIPSDLGSNVERLKYAAIPIALLAAALAPRRVLLVDPAHARRRVLEHLRARAHRAARRDRPGALAAYWSPAIGYLRAHLSPSFRVEAVDTVEHWPAAYLPDAGHPDRARLVPAERLSAERVAVRPRRSARRHTSVAARTRGALRRARRRAAGLQRARTKPRLIRSGTTSLVRVFRSAHVSVYELPDAAPIITGAGDASVLWMWPTRIVARSTRPAATA